MAYIRVHLRWNAFAGSLATLKSQIADADEMDFHGLEIKKAHQIAGQTPPS
jgi:hypothetical protein